MTSHFIKNARQDGRTFYCPNGHKLTFGDNELDKLKKQLAREETRRAQAQAYASDQRERANATERRLSAQKGVTTRLKNRVSKGVCPCCNRHFVDLERHMKGQHPEFMEDES